MPIGDKDWKTGIYSSCRPPVSRKDGSCGLRQERNSCGDFCSAWSRDDLQMSKLHHKRLRKPKLPGTQPYCD